MINKFFKLFLLFSFFIFVSGCSFDTKTGIWNEKKKRKEIDTKLIKLSTDEDLYKKEFNPQLKISLNYEAKKNNTWAMSGFNNSNLIKHLKFEGQTHKFSKHKFKKIKHNVKNNNSIVLKDNYFIINGDEGSIIKFNNNKKIQWKKNVYTKKEKKKIFSISSTLYKDTLYIADNIGKYYALDSKTGKVIWVKKHKSMFNSQIKVDKNKIFVVDSNNVINCFSTEDGKKIWNYVTNPTFIKTNKKLSIIITPKAVLFVNTAGDIVKLNITTGELIWFVPTQNTLIRHETNFLETSDIVLFNDNLFFSNNFSKLFSLNINSGTINWVKNISSNLRPIIIDDYLFTVSLDGFFIITDVSSGEILRSNFIFKKFASKIQKKISSKGFLIASNRAFVTTNLGHLIVISVNTGKIEKISKVGSSELSEPFVVNNRLYVFSNKSAFIFN